MTLIQFKDFPDFTPNMTPVEMFEIGIMGGSYFRRIQSPVTQKVFKNRHLRYPFLKQIDKKKYMLKTYDKSINKYNVEVGTSYEYWMSKGWIREDIDPYGWIEWYCNFWMGRRTDDDKRQINRWKRLAGANGRFRKQLQKKINSIGVNDEKIFIRMRQTLLHWGFDSSKMKPEGI